MSQQENKAVFLDRDGVLIHDVNYLSDINDIKYYDDVVSGLRLLKENGFLLIMVTNQSGVARGYFDEAFVNLTHKTINDYFKNHQCKLDGIYYCPHHVDGKPPYDIDCQCRKPLTGMVQSAVRDFNINLADSYLIGDKKSDIELAFNAEIEGILVETGKGKAEKVKVEESFPTTTVVATFSDATSIILSNYRETRQKKSDLL